MGFLMIYIEKHKSEKYNFNEVFFKVFFFLLLDKYMQI